MGDNDGAVRRGLVKRSQVFGVEERFDWKEARGRKGLQPAHGLHVQQGFGIRAVEPLGQWRNAIVRVSDQNADHDGKRLTQAVLAGHEPEHAILTDVVVTVRLQMTEFLELEDQV